MLTAFRYGTAKKIDVLLIADAHLNYSVCIILLRLPENIFTTIFMLPIAKDMAYIHRLFLLSSKKYLTIKKLIPLIRK
jgi:hypothetical protein